MIITGQVVESIERQCMTCKVGSLNGWESKRLTLLVSWKKPKSELEWAPKPDDVKSKSNRLVIKYHPPRSLASNEAEADPENHACTCASSSL
jgi:hypothetical protein